MYVDLTADGRHFRVDSDSVLAAALNDEGFDIPLLCNIECLPGSASCQVCVVKNSRTKKLIPACSTVVSDGMQIETSPPEVLHARRRSLALLFYEHRGECTSPCSRACPAGLDVPAFLSLVKEDRTTEALAFLLANQPLPTAVSCICTAACERACVLRETARSVGGSVPVSRIKVEISRPSLEQGRRSAYFHDSPIAQEALVIGAGPAGLCAAHYLRRSGFRVTLIDGSPVPGGSLISIPEGKLPRELPRKLIEAEVSSIIEGRIDFRGKIRIDDDRDLKRWAEGKRVVLVDAAAEGDTIACGIRYNGAFVYRIGGSAEGSGGTLPVEVKRGREAVDTVLSLLKTGEPPPRRFDFTGWRRKNREEERGKRREKSENSGTPVVAPTAAPAAAASVKTGGDSHDRDFNPVIESQRCLQCGCHRRDDCRLRDLATKLGLSRKDLLEPRRVLPVAEKRFGRLLYDPGKCIRCGACMRLAEKGNIPSLTFVKRGRNTEITSAFDISISEGQADLLTAVCPAGALRSAGGEERK